MMAVIALGLSLGSYLIRIVFPCGFWLPIVFPGFQLAYAVQYITAFFLGIAAFKSNTLSRLPKIGGACLGLAAFIFFWCWIITIVLVTTNSKNGVNATAPLFGGGSLESLFFTTFEQTFAVIWSIGLLVSFREHNDVPSSIYRNQLVGSAYVAYLIHPLIVFSITRVLTLAWLPFGSFTLLIHILITMIVSVPFTWLLAIAIKFIPGAGKVV